MQTILSPMFAFIKLALIPCVGAAAFLYDATATSNIVAYLGIAAFIAGALLVGRYREALAISERERDTLTDINKRLAERNAILEAQPNLEQHARLLSKLADRMEAHDKEMKGVAGEQIALLREIRTAVIASS